LIQRRFPLWHAFVEWSTSKVCSKHPATRVQGGLQIVSLGLLSGFGALVRMSMHYRWATFALLVQNPETHVCSPYLFLSLFVGDQSPTPPIDVSPSPLVLLSTLTQPSLLIAKLYDYWMNFIETRFQMLNFSIYCTMFKFNSQIWVEFEHFFHKYSESIFD